MTCRVTKLALTTFLCTFCAAGGFSGQLVDGGSETAGQPPGQAEKQLLDPKQWFLKGEDSLRGGDLDSAEAAFRQVLAADPRSGGAYANLGVIAMRRKQWDRALTLLQKAQKLEPKVSGILLNIGLVNYHRSDYQAAIPPLSSVLREQPDAEQPRYLLGLCYLFTERYADAVSTLEPLWPGRSNDFAYLYALSVAANEAGQKEAEERALTRLIEVGGDTAEFHLMLGKAYLNRRESERAVTELERAASLKPDLPFVHMNLGIAYMRMGKSARAEEEFRRDIAIEPDVADTYELLGDFYLRTGKEQEAEQSFHEALRRNARMPGSLVGLAKIYLQQEKYREALATIDRAAKLAPNAENVHFLRGRILTKLGRRAEAQEELAAAARMENAAGAKEAGMNAEDRRVPNPELAQPH